MKPLFESQYRTNFPRKKNRKFSFGIPGGRVLEFSSFRSHRFIFSISFLSPSSGFKTRHVFRPRRMFRLQDSRFLDYSTIPLLHSTHLRASFLSFFFFFSRNRKRFILSRTFAPNKFNSLSKQSCFPAFEIYILVARRFKKMKIENQSELRFC